VRRRICPDIAIENSMWSIAWRLVGMNAQGVMTQIETSLRSTRTLPSVVESYPVNPRIWTPPSGSKIAETL